jgi:hypothetical protein
MAACRMCESYSFVTRANILNHWQTQTGALLLRWDNAPHHPEIPTFPRYKHKGERVIPFVRVTVEEVLAALAKRLQKRGQGT